MCGVNACVCVCLLAQWTLSCRMRNRKLCVHAPVCTRLRASVRVCVHHSTNAGTLLRRHNFTITYDYTQHQRRQPHTRGQARATPARDLRSRANDRLIHPLRLAALSARHETTSPGRAGEHTALGSQRDIAGLFRTTDTLARSLPMNAGARATGGAGPARRVRTRLSSPAARAR